MTGFTPFHTMGIMKYDLFYLAGAGLLLLTIFLLAAFCAPVSRIRRSMRKAWRYLDSEWKIQQNPTFFLKEGFRMFSHAKLNAIWERYLGAVARCGGDYRYADISEFFSAERTIDELTDTALASLAPWIPGILGPAMAASALLYYSASGALTASFRIEAAALTLLGALAALILAVNYKSCVFAARKELRTFSQWIAAKHQTANGLPQQLADLRRTIQAYSQDQLKFFASLDHHIEVHIAQAMQPFLDGTKNAIEAFISAATERQTESMQHLAEYFAQNTTQLYQEQIQKISDATQSMAEIQERTTATLSSITTVYTESRDCIRQIGEVSSGVLDRYETYLPHLETIRKSLEDTSDQMENLAEFIRNHSRGQTFTIENLSKFQQDLLAASDESTRAMKEFFRDFNDQYSSSIISLRAASADILRAGELLKNSYSGLVEDVNLDVGQVFRTFEENLASISIHLGESIRELQEAVDELPEVLRRMGGPEKV